jgi:curved DNA-binding protein
MHTDYYALLGIPRTATAEDIKSAYRRLAQRLHPDVSADPAAAERFIEITRAYQVLRDPDQRVRYELEEMERALDLAEQGISSVPPMREFVAPPPSVPPRADDEPADSGAASQTRLQGLFKRFVQGRGGRDAGGGSVSPGDDHEVSAEVTFEEAVRGGHVLLTFAVPELNGSGRRASERAVAIRVPKGAFEGQRLRLKGLGGPGLAGGTAGDLLVEIAYRPHRLFRRIHENDIWFYLPIAPWEAVLGAVLEIPTLDKPFRVHVPAGSTSGHTFRVKGRGLPRADGGRGDLLACLRIVTPEVPNDVERQLYLQLSRSSRFNPRRGFG